MYTCRAHDGELGERNISIQAEVNLARLFILPKNTIQELYISFHGLKYHVEHR